MARNDRVKVREKITERKNILGEREKKKKDKWKNRNGKYVIEK